MAEFTKRDTKVVIDTNLLLDDSKILFKLSKEYTDLILPITVLQELDKHKFKQNTSYSAREAIRAIIEFKSKNTIIFDTEGCTDAFNNDQSIIASAKRHDAVLATKDMSMSVIAESQGVTVRLFDVILNNIFNPYVSIKQDALYWNCSDGVFGFGRVINDDAEGKDYTNTFNLFEKAGEKTLNEDAWFFVFIKVPSPNPVIYAHNPIKKIFVKIDDDPKYRQLVIDKHAGIKALDIYQTCAIYAMIEAPNTLLCGSYGSGKSLLSTAFSLTNNDTKTFISRPNLTVDRRFELGFLPGSMEDKLFPWMTGILSSLYHIYSNTRAQKSDKLGNSTSYDFVKDTIFKKNFEMLSLETIQGLSFMDRELLLLDEVQLCSISVLSVILSRFGKGSKLIMTGDLGQTYGTIPPAENGLLKLMRLMPSKHMAYVKLKNNYRSELLELADQLQDKTLY